ncbi:MAG: 4'-phosphopantetheinyl transferase superfamily protein [Labilithrix sp.]|nr:4'-phosphopantetheinyl transferase superfamily protein [Labilithrix sp.]MCW5816783.1 4'-phosphopantetheinyl transferase superfamily protein [Labilithrix sp.]
MRAELERYRRLLSDDEVAREGRLHLDADKERFVIGRALVRLQLSRLLGGDPRELPLVTNPYGRPELASSVRTPIGFNVSHADDLVVCAITGTLDVGVDVERVEPRRTYGLAHRFFAAREVADLQRRDEAERARVFFDYWTLKEAYIKARGLGLALPLDAFAFTLRPPHPPTISFDPSIDDDPDTWQFAQAWPTERHRLAVAVRRPPGRDLDVLLQLTAARSPCALLRPDLELRRPTCAHAAVVEVDLTDRALVAGEVDRA